MITTFSLFRFCNVIYQALVVFFVYGLGVIQSSRPALIREGIWCLFLLTMIVIYNKNFLQYWKCRKTVCISFIILILVSIIFSYLFSDASYSDMFIGIKYGFWRMFILISASFLGFSNSENRLNSKFIKNLHYILLGIVVLGFFWHGAKLIRPDFFYNLGYGGLDDYSYGSKPPIYYLTGYEGVLRRQGLFSGPNNYGYFLVAFLPFIWHSFCKNINSKDYKSKFFWITATSIIIWIIAMICTLSRAVLVGNVIVFLFMFWKKITKLNKNFLLGGGACILICLIGLSLLKRESTIGHITSKLDTIPAIISAPLGHGLGSSGPAVHYQGVYLPENYFLQIMLDIGTVGFLFRCFAMIYILWIQYKIIKIEKNSLKKEELDYYNTLHSFQIGFFALMIMGMFLHVFEDSMVNYLFFTIYGILLGALSKNIKKSVGRKIKIEK